MSNAGIEAFNVDIIEDTIIVDPEDSLIFSVLNKDIAVDYLYQELVYHKLLQRCTRQTRYKALLNQSIDQLMNSIAKVKNTHKELKSSRYSINPSMIGMIQYYQNNTNDPVRLSYSDCVILCKRASYNDKKRHNQASSELHSRPKRLIVFYIDNISQYTINNILSDNEYKYISRIVKHDEYIKIKNHMSISNWTQPAAISMLSGLPFEEHKIFQPNQKKWLPIINAIYNTRIHKEISKLKRDLPLLFRCGTNWKMKQEHGISSLFDHCISNPEFSDCYTTLSQAIKQIEIAGSNPSMHWIDLMDAHHPMNESILPLGSRQISQKTLQEGMVYATGPKVKSNSNRESSEDIYRSQLKSIDNAIGIILTQSYKYIDQNNHMIAIVSDHGSSFIQWNNKRDSLIEKHSPHVGFLRIGLGNDVRQHIEKQTIYASELFPTIEMIFNNRITAQKTINEIPYSQIFYPGKKYEFICLLNKIVFHYTSYNSVPNLNDRQILFNPNYLNHLFEFGDWERIGKENEITKIKVMDLPANVNITFKKVWRNWTS